VTSRRMRGRLFRVRIEDGSTVEVGPQVQCLDSNSSAMLPPLRSSPPTRASRLVSCRTGQDRSCDAVRDDTHRSRGKLLAPSADRAQAHRLPRWWSSDRGLVASDISILDIATGDQHRRPSGCRASAMKWRDDDSLWFTGWSRLGSSMAFTRLDGTSSDDAGRCDHRHDSFSAGITTAPDKKGFAAVRESDGVPPEMSFQVGAESSSWSAFPNLNGTWPTSTPTQRSVPLLERRGWCRVAGAGPAATRRARGRGRPSWTSRRPELAG